MIRDRGRAGFVRVRLLLLGAMIGFGSVRPAAAAFFTGDMKEPELRRRIARLPDDDRSKTKAELYSALGDRLYDRGDMANAAAAYESALESRTSLTMQRHIYLYLGKSY